MNAYDVLQEMNRVIFARRFDEFRKLLEKLADTDLLVHDENWILRYAVLVSPDKFFFLIKRLRRVLITGLSFMTGC